MIHINLIPSNLWELNLRKILGPEQWLVLSNRIREQQRFTCQACKISLTQLKNKKWFHAHEMWKFEEATGLVSLSAIVCLCTRCHQATHMGFACVQNKTSQAVEHLCKVNHWTTEDAIYYLEVCFEQWSRQSQRSWKFNLSSLSEWLTPEEFKLVDGFLHEHNLV